jgi:hypothetical protein
MSGIRRFFGRHLEIFDKSNILLKIGIGGQDQAEFAPEYSLRLSEEASSRWAPPVLTLPS